MVKALFGIWFIGEINNMLMNVQEFFERLRFFIESARKFDQSNAFWVLKTCSTEHGRGTPIAKNWNISDLGDSLSFLEENIRNLGPGANKYLFVMLYEKKGDKEPFVFKGLNPYYTNQPTVSNNGAISGFGGSNPGIFGNIGMIERHYQERIGLIEKNAEERLERKILEMEYERRLDDMSAEIESVKQSKKGLYDLLLKALENPVIKQLALTLGTNAIVSKAEQSDQNKSPIVENIDDSERAESMQDHQQQIEETGQIIAESLQHIDNAVPGESISILQELAAIAKNDPNQAKMLREYLKQMKNGQNNY
jgi:hypothetical protein